MSNETIIGTQVRLLQGVRAALDHPDLVSKITQTARSKPPILTVVNTQAPGLLTAEIHCEQRNETWTLVYDWDETTPADDPARAAASIRKVLMGR